MAQCKKCGVLLQQSDGRGRPPEYCLDCEINRERERKLKSRDNSSNFLGNPKDDIRILRILHKKRQSNDKRY